jgi:HAD superfamily phosphoserine phosphatase-like hydrolase
MPPDPAFDRVAMGASPPSPVAAGAPIPPLRPGVPPIAVLVDYDGTIAENDVTDLVLYRVLGEVYRDGDDDYNAGLVGSRTLFEEQVKLLPGDPAEMIRLMEGQPHDPAFPAFARRALELGIPVEVVSDSFDFFLEPALRKLGAPEMPVIAATLTFDGERAAMAFPNGHPDCFVCGTCKRQRVLAHQAAGRIVAFVGDGETDRYAAAYADVIFAKHKLIDLCRREGWPFTPWRDFAELEAWLERTVAAWNSDPGSLPRHSPRPFICGPEHWGPGRKNPIPRD